MSRTMITKTLPQSLKGQGGTITALLSIVSGVIFGSLLRNFCDLGQEGIIWIALPGELFMRMLTCLSMPLVLPKLVTAIGSLDPKSGGKILGKVLLFYATVNIVIEITGILTFYAINSTNSSKTDIVLNNDYPNDVLPTSFFIHDLLFNLVPENIATAPFQRYVTKMGDNNGTVTYNDGTTDSNNILGLVVAATSVGMVLAQLGESGKPLLQVCSSVSAVTSLMMEIVIKWVCPPGLFSLVASQILILQNPAESLKDVTMFVITVIAGNLVLPLFLLPVIYVIFKRSNPFKFYYNLGEAVVMICGTSSSISTFPVTLRCLVDKNHTDSTISSMVLSMGVLINLCSYPMVGVLYVARKEGMDLGISQIIVTMIILVIIVNGTSGIPQDSFMTVVFLCGMHGIPITYLANVLAVDWLLDRVDAVCKVLTDSTAVGVISCQNNNEKVENSLQVC